MSDNRNYLDCGDDYLSCNDDYLNCSDDVLPEPPIVDDIPNPTPTPNPAPTPTPSPAPYQPPRKDNWLAELFYSVIAWFNRLFSRGRKW